jgi:hypothetical protein
MKRIFYTLSLIGLTLGVNAQVLTELLVPQYFSARTAATAGNARMPLFFCFQVTGLTPNQSYDLKLGMALTSEAATSFGAGNFWNWTTTAPGTTNVSNAFTTDASGNSGPVWACIQPTGNSTGGRLAPGSIHNIRYGIVANGGSMPSSPNFVGNKTTTGLDLAISALTPAVTTDDGAFIQGSALVGGSGKIVLAYSNAAGTGDPLAIGLIRNSNYSQGTNAELPTAVNNILMGPATAPTPPVIGDYALLIPIGANNPNGIQRLETRSMTNVILTSYTDADGIWPSGANTTTAARRDVILINSTDAALPVTWKSFTATKGTDANVLKWSTASETNNAQFEVQRSTNGKSFETLATVKGAGNSNKALSYSFNDVKAPAAKTVYYRLKQVDFDGKSEYSKTVSIVNVEQKTGLGASLPNPFNNELNVTINSVGTSNATVTVMDMIGKVHRTSNEQLVAGSNRIAIETTDMPDGIYFVQVSVNGETFTQKVIKK